MIRGFHDEMGAAGIGGMVSTTFRLCRGGDVRDRKSLLTSNHYVNNIEPMAIQSREGERSVCSKALAPEGLALSILVLNRPKKPVPEICIELTLL